MYAIRSYYGKELEIKRLTIDSIASNRIYFKQGYYDEFTGETKYTEYVYPSLIQKMLNLHMTSSKNPNVWFTTFFGIALLFLATSSIWMFKSKTKIFKKGILVAIAGLVATILILYSYNFV